MRILFLAALSACAWTPRDIGPYPDGLTIRQVDQWTLDNTCDKIDDEGNPVKDVRGCYDPKSDTIYARADCSGAMAVVHELAHRQGVAKPKRAGFQW